LNTIQQMQRASSQAQIRNCISRPGEENAASPVATPTVYNPLIFFVLVALNNIFSLEQKPQVQYNLYVVVSLFGFLQFGPP
jgi:hypothetical protein